MKRALTGLSSLFVRPRGGLWTVNSVGACLAAGSEGRIE